MIRVLVAGFGSIGARHSRLLDAMGVPVACVTRNTACPYPVYGSIAAGVEAFNPSHVLIANATADHLPTLNALIDLGWRGPMLIEKPLFNVRPPAERLAGLDIVVAYNLRFHPLVRALRQQIGGQRLFAANFRVGQYLPDWRPAADYRRGYSASNALGGGVLRDLSHEIDLSYMFCGRFRAVTAQGGHFSNLEISSDDVFQIIGEAERCRAVSIELNYLDRKVHRSIFLNGPEGTAHLDLAAGRLSYRDLELSHKGERDETYIAQLNAFLEGDRSEACLLKDGLLIDAATLAMEEAAQQQVWRKL